MRARFSAEGGWFDIFAFLMLDGFLEHWISEDLSWHGMILVSS